MDDVVTSLKSAGIRVKTDERAHMRPGAKYFEWERKGLPLRIDIGPRDIISGKLSFTVRGGEIGGNDKKLVIEGITSGMIYHSAS
jgi:prolyl-tRNA synthetase